MTKIYNTTTGQSTDISILQDGIHCEGDILGNMDITSDGTGVFAVADDGPSSEDEAQADSAGCSYYGDNESVTWWTDYVNGYNATQDDLNTAREEIEDSDKSAAEIVAELKIDPRQDQDVNKILDWLTDNEVDYETERGAFLDKLEELRAAL